MALLLKGLTLLVSAFGIRESPTLPILAIGAGVAVGALKARLLFAPACRRNLRRIDALARPMLWQFYRARFFLFLVAMIALGAWLSRVAAGRYALLLGVAALDLALATALLTGSSAFWRRRALISAAATTSPDRSAPPPRQE
jgi:hypothetical protein